MRRNSTTIAIQREHVSHQGDLQAIAIAIRRSERQNLLKFQYSRLAMKFIDFAESRVPPSPIRRMGGPCNLGRVDPLQEGQGNTPREERRS